MNYFRACIFIFHSTARPPLSPRVHYLPVQLPPLDMDGKRKVRIGIEVEKRYYIFVIQGSYMAESIHVFL